MADSAALELKSALWILGDRLLVSEGRTEWVKLRNTAQSREND